MPVPARPSRKVLMTGIAAPTAASKFSAPPCFSADFASRNPCLAISALLAVTTDLPDFSAASIADSAGSPEPPINSTKQSIPGSLASSSVFLAEAMPRRSRPRFLTFERAVTATTRTPRPLRAKNALELASDPGIDCFVELMGGSGEPALSAIEAALKSGKSVVTANKALIAKHGLRLAKSAEKHGGALNFEAAVRAAIPRLTNLREGLAGTHVNPVSA